MKGILPVLLFGGLAYLIFSSAKKFAANLSFAFLGGEIDKKNTSLTNVAAKLFLGIQNDSNNSATLNRIYLQYYYKGKIIGRTDTSQEINIKPLALTKLTLPLNIPTGVFLASLGYSLTDLLMNRINPEIEIKGKIFVSGGSIDIDEKKAFKIV